MHDLVLAAVFIGGRGVLASSLASYAWSPLYATQRGLCEDVKVHCYLSLACEQTTRSLDR